MGDDEDEVIIIEEDCDELEEAAEKALDENMKIWKEYSSITMKWGDALQSAFSCRYYLWADRMNMNYEAFEERLRECLDLEKQFEELDEKLEELKFDHKESSDAYYKAKDKWKDCIHEETRVRMRLPE
ncbi:MAG TPA: hypothetical protein VIP70_12560 [Nitrososphaeraceae archaeon]|jgi:hypothetical protein